MSAPVFQLVKDTFIQKGMSGVFQEVLGWDAASNQTLKIQIGQQAIEGKLIASLIGTAAVALFSTDSPLTSNLQRSISIEVGKRFPERLVGFESQGITTWLWPKRTSSGSQTFERIDVPSDSIPTFFAQRLAGLRFSIADHSKGISPIELKNRLRGAFDTSKVTKKFYDGFRLRHKQLADEIKGLPEDQTASYASVLLNRLMFIYFLQKKEFLNSDPNYLRNSLNKLQALKKKDSFYSFYRDLLLDLFFQGLNNEEHNYSSPEIAAIIGKVPYVNGGIFEETEAEKQNKIEVPDSVFENIFKFFDSFTWHLDTRPTGNPEEINPEVIGYIFEQYINFTSNGKKENGAYYTKQDVTGYMVSQTLIPRVLDLLIEIGLEPLKLIPSSGFKYVNESMKHGLDEVTNTWQTAPADYEAIWKDDPANWLALDDAELDEAICLPGESWVEMFNRRQAVNDILSGIETFGVESVDSVVTLNLNGQLLLTDAIDAISHPDDFQNLWSRFSKLSIIDPTCGSGAFLFAALEVLEDIYSHLIDLADQLESSFASEISNRILSHNNRRYFIRKQAALNNLYGTDLMPDAIETAKLRVFLALASCLEPQNEIEPLPDLDFNLKVGNLILGLKDEQGSNTKSTVELFDELEINGFRARIEEYKSIYKVFVETSENSPNAVKPFKEVLTQNGARLRKDANRLFAREHDWEGEELELYLEEKRPFHWFAEFPQVFALGGFDVIVGNPPYVRTPSGARGDFAGYKTQVCPDLYAVCFERAISLLSPSGRMSFITPLNLAFSDDFKVLRQVIQDNFKQLWWSTYDQLPQGLFEGAAIRNTIVVAARLGEKANYSALHNIFTVASRQWLFDCLTYFEQQIKTSSALIPRSGLASDLVSTLLSSERDLGRIQKSSACLKSTANYWVPVSPIRPPVLDLNFKKIDHEDTELHELKLGSFEDPDVVVATLSGKIGFVLWQAIGDGMHVSSSQMEHLRKALPIAAHATLAQEARRVIEAGLDNTVVNKYRGKNFVSIRWAGIRKTSDIFDKQVMDQLGLQSSWRLLNIVYRQLMKANDSRQSGQDTARNRAYWSL